MQITNKEYARIVNERSPKSRVVVNSAKAFLIGGGICVLGQLFFNLYSLLGADRVLAGALNSMTLIFISSVLTGLKLYDKIAKHAGAGTLVPITGFANSVVSPALEFKGEGYILGIGGRMFTIAGPVIVYGVAASTLYGIIYYIFK